MSAEAFISKSSMAALLNVVLHGHRLSSVLPRSRSLDASGGEGSSA